MASVKLSITLPAKMNNQIEILMEHPSLSSTERLELMKLQLKSNMAELEWKRENNIDVRDLEYRIDLIAMYIRFF